MWNVRFYITWIFLLNSCVQKGSAEPTWGDELIILSDPSNAFNITVNANGGQNTMTIREEMNLVGSIGKTLEINYQGKNGPITVFTDDAEFKCSVIEDSGKYYLDFLSTPDYDVSVTKPTAAITLTDKEGASSVLIASLFNIDDNQPVVTPQPGNNCSIEENSNGAVEKCLFDISDKDGCVENTKFQFYASDEISGNFDIKLQSPESTYPACLQSDNTVKSASGALQVLSDLDFEKTLSYFLTFQYSNGIYIVDSPLSTILNVVDMPDELPRWISVIPTFPVDEEASATFKIEANDGDVQIHAAICYELEVVDSDSDSPINQTERDYFSINPNSGEVSIGGIDRDGFKRNTYNLLLTAVECENDTSRINQTTMVLVRDAINKNLSYTITDGAAMYQDFPVQSFPENSVFQLDCTVIVTDPDEGNAGTFKASLEGSSGFVVLPTRAFQSGEFTIQSTSMMDYENETLREIHLTLIVEEVQDPSHKLSLPITVSITNENDEAPVFQETEQNALHFSIPENAKEGAELGTVKATDADNDPITYGLVNTDDLVIDETSGLIKIKGARFDYERQQQVQYQMFASDGGVHTTYISLIVAIEDINDTPPTIDVQSKSALPVLENADAKSEVAGVDIRVSDGDSNHSLTVDIDWSLSYGYKDYVPVDASKYQDWFEIALPDSTTGKLLLTVGNGLDWSVADNLQLAVVVTDENTQENSRSSSALLNVLISDVNNKAPVFVDGICDILSDKFRMNEGSDVGLIVGTVRATDADGPGNNVILYSLSDSAETRISIEESTGVVTTGSGANAVDYEAETNISIIVTAFDDVHSVTCNLEIKVVDVNDEIPVGVPDPDSGVVSFPEDTEDGTWVTIQGYDNDSTDAFKTIKFIMRGDQGYQDLFELTDHKDNSADVAVRLANSMKFDYESGVRQYQLSVILTDNPDDTNHQLSSTTTITVMITDVNDNPPVFVPLSSPDACLFSVKEDVSSGLTITGSTKIQSSDKDSGENGRISYKIANVDCVPNTNNVCPTDRNDLFSLNSDSADVTSKGSLLGKFGHYAVNVTAEDHGEPVMSAWQLYVFCVEDINDHYPVFVYPNASTTSISVQVDDSGQLLDGVTGGPLANFKVTDEDFGVNAKAQWEIEPKDVFSLQSLSDRNEAILHVVGNSDNLQRTKVTLRACDSPADGDPLCSSQDVEIVPRQTKPVEPVFDTSSFSVEFEEASTEEKITIPHATDGNNEGLEGSDPIQNIYYYIISTEPQPEDGVQQFSLNKDSGELSVVSVLDASICDQYNITVQASNEPNENELPRPGDQSLLTINMTVKDINDKPPVFTRGGKYLLSMTSNDAGKFVLSVEAVDPDRHDSVSYELVKDSIEMNLDNDGGIDKGSVFSLDPVSGSVKVDKYPTTATSGYFAFNVTAKDTGGVHEATASVTIYVISDQYLIPAIFRNTQAEVAAYINEFVEMVTEAYKYACIPGQLVTDDPYTTLPVYFLDNEGKPIKPTDMAVVLNDYNTSHVLQRDVLTRYGLDLTKFGSDLVAAPSTEDSINTALIVVCAVLAALLIASAIFYFIKTRRLTGLVNRLTNAASEDASDKKGFALPNTNLHTQEGANPVWNTEVVPDFDRVSTTSSDDSGLIGIEDNPEFQSFYNQVILKAKQADPSDKNDLIRENPQLRGLTLDDDIRY